MDKIFKFKLLNIIFLQFACGSIFSLYAQNQIIGYYRVTDPFTQVESKVRLYKTTAGTYAGEVCWVKDDPNNKYLKYVFLWNLTYDSTDNEYKQGHIKYPGIPGTYRTFMRFENDSTLKVRGYLGVSALGKTVYWKKEK